MTIPSQPAQSSVSGQPSVSLQLVDASGRPLTNEVQLGACGGALAPPDAGFPLPAPPPAAGAASPHGPRGAVARDGGRAPRTPPLRGGALAGGCADRAALGRA